MSGRPPIARSDSGSAHDPPHADLLIERLLAEPAALPPPSPDEGPALAAALKAHFDTYKYVDINRARPAVAALERLAAALPADLLAGALAAWARGDLLIHEGRPDDALPLIGAARERLLALGDQARAAATQVTLVSALGTLGRHGEAIAVALEARAALAAAGDSGRVASLDLNLGHLSYFTSRYEQASEHYARAEQVFAALDDVPMLARARAGRAEVLVEQGRFAEGVRLHEATLALAEQHNDLGQIALSNNNLGYLYAQQGLYHQAIGYFQRDIELHGALGGAQDQRQSELYLAEAYLQLNLFDEVVFRCAALAAHFAAHSMRFQQATALALLGVARGRLGEGAPAREALAEAEAIFLAIGSLMWAASLQLFQAGLALAQGDHDTAGALAAGAERRLLDQGLRGRAAEARWLRGEALRLAGRHAEAAAAVEAARAEAERCAMPALRQRCATALGLLARARGDLAAARAGFLHAVELIEEGRAALPGEELRVAYFADKLTPYQQLAGLAIDAGDVAAAFAWIERARGRAMLDLARVDRPPASLAPPALRQRYEQLRHLLQLRYNRLNRPDDDDDLGSAEWADLEREVAGYEQELAALHRQIRADSGSVARPPQLADLQAALPADTQLLTYWVDDGAVTALLVSGDQAALLPRVAAESEVAAALRQLRQQIGKLSYGPEYLARHQGQLLATINAHLQALHAHLIAPLAGRLSAPRLIIVPHGLLHYVPFAALHDGTDYMLRRHAISLLPTVGLLSALRRAPDRPIRRPLLVGVPDDAIPQVAGEIRRLAAQFPQAELLYDAAASGAGLRGAAGRADALHLACHAVFRPTNPLFSALRLADGWLTVRDAYDLDLRRCQLVALSACETGVSQIAPGDELLGLARGFISAGARAMLLSQWVADDSAAALVMERFYAALAAGSDYAEALRGAQLAALERYPNPSHWATFVVLAS